MFDRLGGYADGITDGSCRTGTVADDADSIDAEKGAAPVGFVAPSLLGRLEGILGDERPKLTNRCGFDVLFQPFEHYFCRILGRHSRQIHRRQRHREVFRKGRVPRCSLES